MLKQLLYGLKRPFHFVKTGLLEGLRAEFTYRFPARQLTILGITGTDGKTTSSTLLHHVLTTAGIKAGLISTVAAYIGDTTVDTGFHVTSPQPDDLHKFLHELVDQGFTHVVLEATSHGLYQYRTWGANPSIAGVTNINKEHLDYHLDYKRYVQAKALLFKKAKVAVLNADDTSYRYLRPLIKRAEVIGYSQEDQLPSPVMAAIKARFPEKYNQMNARLVYTMAKQVGVADQDFIEAVKTFPQIPGRMEVVETNLPFTTIVDFAHTPQGLEGALTAIRQEMKRQKSKGKLIAIFGCAGLRDFTKRPVMGKLGATLADLAIFTAEDPRTEDVWSIIRQMKEQLTEHHDKILSIADRREAIEFALTKLAQKGDTVVVLGKGHEKSMCFGTVEYPWSDQDAIREIAKSMTKAKKSK